MSSTHPPFLGRLLFTGIVGVQILEPMGLQTKGRWTGCTSPMIQMGRKHNMLDVALMERPAHADAVVWATDSLHRCLVVTQGGFSPYFPPQATPHIPQRCPPSPAPS